MTPRKPDSDGPESPEDVPGDGPGTDGLRRLERQLYARRESDTLKERGEDIKQLGVRQTSTPDTDGEQPPVMFKSIAAARRKRRRRITIVVAVIVGLVIVFGSTVAATVWYRLRQNVTDQQIGIAVNAPTQLTAGDEIAYTVTYQNDSYVDWQNVELVFEPPATFSFDRSDPAVEESGRQYLLTVGDLPSGERGSITVIGRLLGEEEASLAARAELSITPENFPSGRFSKAALATTTISALPINVSIEMASKAAAGERVLATLTVTNNSSQALVGSYVTLKPPVGIQLATDDPQFSPELDQASLTWQLPELEPLATVKRVAVLFVEGQPGEQRAFEVAVGVAHDGQQFVQRTASAVLTLSASQLSIAQQYNDAPSPQVVETGQRIQGKITYTNSGTTGLTDAVVQTVIDGPGFNPASLKLTGGAYNPTTRTITWTSATVPELGVLQPQQTGELTFEFEVNAAADFPTDSEESVSTITLVSSIDSPDITVPVGQERTPVSNRSVLSVASDVTLAADAFYDDGRLGITSTGPVPPAVGQETTYTVRLRLGSTLNDIGDVRISATLPDGVRYTDQVIKTVGDVTFNDRTGEVVWTVPLIEAFTGRGKPPAELNFQVAITPGENQRNSVITFLNRLTAEATDLFTDTELAETVTSFPSTETAARGQGRVQ